MILIRQIQYHRVRAAVAYQHSDDWYFHLGEAAKYVREWRIANTLTPVILATDH